MNALPTWCDTPEGHALIAQIIANPPTSYVTSGDSFNTGGREVYRGAHAGYPAVTGLRRLYNAWWDANYDKPREAPVEDANALIGRVLAEARRGGLVPFERCDWTDVDDQQGRFAA